MDLVKIYNDSDFSEASVPPGEILIFTGRDSYGNAVTRYKDSSGDFGTLSGSGGSTDVILGQVGADGNFQPLIFNGTEAANSGDPEAVENYYGWNGVLPVPDNGIKVGEATEYYKCASVDTVNKTWTGYKAVLTDGFYSFEETVTEGLTYGAAFTPVIGLIHDAACTMLITSVWGNAMYTAIKLQIDEVRNSGNGVQISEFTLVDKEDNEIDWSSLPINSVTADSGNDSPSGEEPEKLLDGNIDTKWFSWQFNAPSFVQINFNSDTSFKDISGYRWYTAGDSSGRDPVSWKVLLLNQQGEWVVVSEVIDYPVTESRKTLVGTWNFNF